MKLPDARPENRKKAHKYSADCMTTTRTIRIKQSMFWRHAAGIPCTTVRAHWQAATSFSFCFNPQFDAVYSVKMRLVDKYQNSYIAPVWQRLCRKAVPLNALFWCEKRNERYECTDPLYRISHQKQAPIRKSRISGHRYAAFER